MKTIDIDKLDSNIIKIGTSLMREIVGDGFEAYIAGGAVRDIVMGKTDVHDIDIATNMPIATIKRKYRTIEYGGGEKHGTVIVRYENCDFELTQFRSEGEYSDGRRPDSVEFIDSFEEDTRRRDLTINSMGLDCDGNVIDYHGGLADIEAGIIRTVGEPRDRFSEDVLRILRAARFAARFGFNIEENTYEAMWQLSHTVTNTSHERILSELQTMCSYKKQFAYGLDVMHRTGIWNIIFPEIKLEDRHLLSIYNADSASPAVAFSILFMGLNKLAIIAICKRLKMSNHEIRQIGYIVSNVKIYRCLSTVDKSMALSIIDNEDFSLLRIAHDAVYGEMQDADSLIDYLLGYVEVRDRTKEVNQTLLGMGYSGKLFGTTSRKVMDWLYASYENGDVPDNTEIIEFINMQ